MCVANFSLKCLDAIPSENGTIFAERGPGGRSELLAWHFFGYRDLNYSKFYPVRETANPEALNS